MVHPAIIEEHSHYPQRFMRIKEVTHITGIARSTLYSYIKDGLFPPPIKLGGSRSVGWLEMEIQKWIADRIASRSDK